MDAQTTGGPAIPPIPPTSVPTPRALFEGAVGETRQALLQVEGIIKNLGKSPYLLAPAATPAEDFAEVQANIKLAYRHAEDCRMRLGKIFQALNGGVSNNTR